MQNLRIQQIDDEPPRQFNDKLATSPVHENTLSINEEHNVLVSQGAYQEVPS
jgi:hypothetical protein